jgi:hypothetical protein
MTDYLLQQGREGYWPLLDLVAPIHQAYADAHDLTYICHKGAVVTKWPGYWDSVQLMLDLSQDSGTGQVFWMDADVLIVSNADMRDVLGEHLVGMARHPSNQHGEHYNCGVLFFRACEQVSDWLRKVLDGGPGEHPYYQQDYMNLYLREPQWAGKVLELPHEWNSTVKLGHPENCNIRAWHGHKGGAVARLQAMQLDIQKRGLLCK